jgi:hypothetical protein
MYICSNGILNSTHDKEVERIMATISGFTEGILISMLFIAVFGVAVFSMNTDYHASFSVGLTDGTNTTSDYNNFIGTADTQIRDAPVSLTSAYGLQTESTWGVAKGMYSLTMNFLNGGWIQNIMGNIGLGESGVLLGITLRVLFLISLISAVLYLFFKVVL